MEINEILDHEQPEIVPKRYDRTPLFAFIVGGIAVTLSFLSLLYWLPSFSREVLFYYFWFRISFFEIGLFICFTFSHLMFALATYMLNIRLREQLVITLLYTVLGVYTAFFSAGLLNFSNSSSLLARLFTTVFVTCIPLHFFSLLIQVNIWSIRNEKTLKVTPILLLILVIYAGFIQKMLNFLR